MNMLRALSIAVVIAIVASLSGVGVNKVEGGASATPKVKAAFITSTSRLGDKGWNDGIAEGVTRAAREFGLEYKIIQSYSDTEYVPNLSRASEEGFNVLIVAGFAMGDAVREVAPRYPKTFFGAHDVEFLDSKGNHVPIPNVREILFREEQPSYLLGVLTAMMLKGKTAPQFKNKDALGVVAGMEIPPVNRFITGYVCGARSVDPSVKIHVTYVGTWQNPPLFREAAIAQYKQGAGSIFEIGGVAGLAIIEAAKEFNFLEMTTDQDKNSLAPDHVLSSAVKDVKQVTYLVIRDAVKGNLKGGRHYYDLASGGVSIAPFHGLSKYVPKTVQAKLDSLTKEIASGKLVPPKTLEDGKACLNGVQFKRPK